MSEMSITTSDVRNVLYFRNVRNVRSSKWWKLKKIGETAANYESESEGLPDIADT
jgi:hypothetical protein